MEKEFITIIKNALKSDYIGDDCAHLKDLEITISQDSLVEGVHFLRDKITPWQLGWKTAMVNISDICASGAEPKYLTVALSLPKDIKKDFIEEFYAGLKSACKNVEIVGGDLTASDKIFISATAIGTTKNRNISSRSNAKIGQKIIISGDCGSSAVGLKHLLENNNTSKFIKKHLEPIAQRDFSKEIATIQKTPYAMMDTSDGLMDALIQIAKASNVVMSVDFDKIPHDKKIETEPNWQELILYGAEDYQLLATVDTIPANAIVIGEVKNKQQNFGVEINNNFISEAQINKKCFKHFS